MYINVCAVSHVGKVREKNQDNLYFNNTIIKNINNPFLINKNNIKTKRPVFMGVFDGMGGMSNGEKASLIAATTAKQILNPKKRVLFAKPLLTLGYICRQANKNICLQMNSQSEAKMGATLSMLSFYQDNFYLCNVGDSPILLFKNGGVSEISHEHSEREFFESLQQKPNKKKKYKLTQHLGIFPDEMEIEPYFLEGKISVGDKFIICSDGLTDMVELDDINCCLKSSKSIEKAIKMLLNKALVSGGKDNITIIGIEIKKEKLI